MLYCNKFYLLFVTYSMKKYELWDIVNEAFNYETPEYILNVGNNFIVINIGDTISGKPKRLKVTMNDIAQYYLTQANNIVSGMRSLAGHYGDWRPIDYLAKECLEYFKLVNKDGLRKVCKKAGLNPKF